jgi:hypothetical protein
VDGRERFYSKFVVSFDVCAGEVRLTGANRRGTSELLLKVKL